MTIGRAPMVFLVGPHGSGKSTLGSGACAGLGLRFVDLPDPESADARLTELVRLQGADVVALPWAPTREYVVDLIGLSKEEAAEDLRALVEELRTQNHASSPAEREGLLSWCEDWRRDFNADPKACEILVDAMARFMLHLRAGGSSPRTVSQVRGELNAAGFLVMCCDAPKGKAVLESFVGGPSQYEYRRKFTDSPLAWARFSSHWKAFATFLRESRAPPTGS